jgi:hypothetical protein
MRLSLIGFAAGVAVLTAASAPVTLLPRSGVSAQSMPPAGRLFGFVQVDDHGAYDGTTIVAHVNGTVCGQATYDANRGLYILDLDSSQADCAGAGNTVWFSVGDCTAYNTGTVPEFSGAEEVDLVAPGSC